jgi:hypothetical protein
MANPSFPQQPTHLQTRAVKVLLRGNRSLEGLIHIPEGQALLTFLDMKKFFVNLTSVRWSDAPPDEEPMAHLSIRMSSIIWVVPIDQALHLTMGPGPTDAGREVELHLVDGWSLNLTLNIAGEQRMSDYFDLNVSFTSLWNARLLSSGQTLERIAVNHDAILAIREI